MAAAAVVTMGTGLAACGGGTPTPTVAHIGSTTTTPSATGGGGRGGASLAQASKYASCMRAHGVVDFPDPTPGPLGGFGFKIQGGPNSSLDPGSARFKAADQACKRYLPNQGVPPQLTAAQQQAFLNWAACIRAHGFPSFPDPSFSGGGVRIRISAPAGGGGGNGPPPALQAAMHACQSKLPTGFGKLGS
jgi:hypothetical protein